MSELGEDIWLAVLPLEARIAGLGEDIWPAVSGSEASISELGKDIWLAVLGLEARISGLGADIWLAVLGPQARISGLGHFSGEGIRNFLFTSGAQSLSLNLGCVGKASIRLSVLDPL